MIHIKERKNKQLLLGMLLLFLTIIVFLFSISVGSVNIGLENVVKILTGCNIENSTYRSIVMNIRLPRALATIIGGACLAVSGLLLQIFFLVQSVVPAPVSVRRAVTDGLAVGCPLHSVAEHLHVLDEFSLGAAAPHALVDGIHQPKFPALTLERGTIFTAAHTFTPPPLVGFQHSQSVALAYFI